MTAAQDLLDLRYRGGAHVESWFFKANEPGGRRAIWLKNTVLGRDDASIPAMAEAWAIAFDRERGHVAVKTSAPLERARFARGSLDVEVDGCELSLGRACGAIAGGTRRVAWELAIGGERAAPIQHLPRLALYDRRFPASKAVSPLADGRANGVVHVDRGEARETEAWRIDEWPAMVGHNWGHAHPSLYAWTHCSSWDDAEDLVLEAVSARARIGLGLFPPNTGGPMLSPMATAVFVRFEGQRWDLNARELFGDNRGSISLRSWEATAEGKGISLHAELSGATDDFVGLHYPNPSGAMTYCLNTELARARLELRLPGRSPIVATSRAAALEIGTRDRQHGVRMYL